jgi:hypothetical protein
MLELVESIEEQIADDGRQAGMGQLSIRPYPHEHPIQHAE